MFGVAVENLWMFGGVLDILWDCGDSIGCLVLLEDCLERWKLCGISDVTAGIFRNT
jgi:hypothetical protein